MLVVKIYGKGNADRDPDYEKGRQKPLEKLFYYFIRINPDEKGFNDYEKSGKVSDYIVELIKKQTKESTKKSLIDDLSKKLLELEFKSNHSIKWKCLKWIFKKMLPEYKKWTAKELKNMAVTKKYLKQDKDYYLVCETYTKKFASIQSDSKNWKKRKSNKTN